MRHRNTEREGKDARPAESLQTMFGRRMSCTMARSIRDGKRCHRTQERKERRLREEHADQSGAAHAQRHAHGDLAAPFDRSRDEQIGDVGARDQQDDARDSHEPE
jgi:hypothetical protein